MEEKINFEERFNRLSVLYNDLNDRFSAQEQELVRYKDNFCPKFKYGDKLWALNGQKQEIEVLKVDEIIINKFGVHYREYVDEKSFKQFPEQFCYESKEIADTKLNKVNKK